MRIEGGVEHFGVHPALLDAAFQATIGLLPPEQRQKTYLPFSVGRLVVHEPGAQRAVVHARLRELAQGSMTADVTLCDEHGRLLVEIEKLTFREAALQMSAQSETVAAANALFRVDWVPSQDPPDRQPAKGRWVVVAEQDDVTARDLVAELRLADRPCVCVDSAHLSEALPAENVVWLPTAANVHDASGAVRRAVEGLLVVQRLASEALSPRVWWVTRAAVPVSPDESPVVAAGALWGLGRTVMEEHPELRCTLVDVDASTSARTLLRELVADDDEQQVAWRQGRRHVARLVRLLAPAGPTTKSPRTDVPGTSPVGGRALRTDGTVLITGGLGTLGMHAARRLIQRGIRHFVLTGRRGTRTPGAAEAVSELEALGAVSVTVVAADVSDADAMRQVVRDISSERPLRGVIHAASVLDDGVLRDQTPERFAHVMAPKVAGALNLDAMTREADLDFFILYSFMSATINSAGQGAYAAANACLDTIASMRRAHGLPAQSIGWGAWSIGGVAASIPEAQKARLARLGLRWITPSLGDALLDATQDRPESTLLAAPYDLRTVGLAFQGNVPSLWRSLVRVTRREEAHGGWAQELGRLPTASRRQAVLETVRSEVACVLSLGGSDAVPASRPLKELGLDSLMSLELRNVLGKRTGIKLPSTLAFDHPTPAAIAEFLLKKLETLAPSDDPAAAKQAAERSTREEILKQIETFDAKLRELGTITDKRIAERLASVAARFTAPEASADEEPESLTDDELFALVEHQTATTRLLRE